MAVSVPLWALLLCTGAALGVFALSVVVVRVALSIARSVNTDRFRVEVRKERALLGELFEAEAGEVRALAESVRKDADRAHDEREQARSYYSRARAAESRARANQPTEEDTTQEPEAQASPVSIVERITQAQRAAGLMIGGD